MVPREVRAMGPDLNEEYWSPLAALAWIVWRDANKARQWIAVGPTSKRTLREFREVAYASDPLLFVIEPPQAYDDLRKALQTRSDFVATGFGSNAFSGRSRQEITRDEWAQLSLSGDMTALLYPKRDSEARWIKRFSNIELKVSDLKRIWPNTSNNTISYNPSPRGRKQVWPRNEIIAEAIHYYEQNGLEKTDRQSDIESHLANWCLTKYGREPDVSFFRRTIIPDAQELYREIRSKTS
jgi:hypothetical protein